MPLLKDVSRIQSNVNKRNGSIYTADYFFILVCWMCVKKGTERKKVKKRPIKEFGVTIRNLKANKVAGPDGTTNDYF